MKLKQGFTLIELLVVIAIIAILLSVLIPSLRLAKDHAKKIGCSANLKSLAMAAIFYADDNDAHTPSSTNTWQDKGVWVAGWVGQTSDTATRTALETNIQIYGNNTDQFTGLYKSQLWPYIETVEAWRCPTDPDMEQLRSYGMAGQWWGRHTEDDDSVWYDPDVPPGTVSRKISDINNASGKFFFVDQLGYNLDAYFAIWYSRPMWWNIPSFRHGGGAVNGYADGHVKGYKMESETVKLAAESIDTNLNNGYRMLQNEVPDSEDLQYYQRATWGKTGW